MIDPNQAIKLLQKRTAFVNSMVAVIMPIAAVVGGYYWYMQHLWEPKITVQSVDYTNGTASITINGKQHTLYAGSVLSAKHGWGVRFAGKQFDTWDRIEVLKNDMTKKTISIK